MTDKSSKFSDGALKVLHKDFVVIGKRRIRPLYAWLIIGLVAGASATLAFVANEQGQFVLSHASCVMPKFAGGSVSPSSVGLGAQFNVSCDYGVQEPGIWVQTPTGGNCKWTGYKGTAAQFTCTAGNSAGTFNEYCTLSNANYCQAQNKVGSLTVGGFACAPGTEDIVANWILPSPVNMNLHLAATGVYKATIYTSTTNPGKLYFVKNVQGYPLDEKTYDANYVRDYMTENGTLGWQNPQDVKQFEGGALAGTKIAPRCIPTSNTANTKLATVYTDKSQTDFAVKTNCSISSTHNLGYSKAEVWNPGNHNFGGTIGTVPTREIKYMWGCNSSYSSCQAIEELWLAQGWGWAEWKNYTLNSTGGYSLAQDTLGNIAQPGTTQPDQPCGDAPLP